MGSTTQNRVAPQQEPMRKVEQCAQSLINAHPYFRGRASQFEFVCRGEVLVVRGLVPTFYLKQVLQTLLKKLEGVRLVDNQVTVVSPDGLSGLLRE